MRRLFAAFFLIGCVSPAVAGEFDVPTLRGSSPFIPAAPKYTRWAGFYIGGQIGYGSASMNFERATQSLIAYLLRTTALENQQHPSEWGVLGTAYPTGGSQGIFLGYNTQWDDVIVGIDVHYNRSGLSGNAPVVPITRTTSAGGNTYIVNVSGDASMRITDFGAARLRGGWIVNNFMPYATVGFAFGRADVNRNAQVSGVENPPTGYPTVACDPTAGCVPFSYSATDGKKSAFIYGWSAGGGVDVLVTPGFFLRAEYEYTSFSRIQGIDAHMNTARVGAGFKF